MSSTSITTRVIKEGDNYLIYFPSQRPDTRARVRVRGYINGHPFAGLAFPAGDDHFIYVTPEMRHAMKLGAGDIVTIEVEPDPFPGPEVDIPDDLAHALEGDAEAYAAFYRMPPSHRRRYVEWLDEARQPESRARRIEHALVMIATDVDPYHPQ
ncbi:MAG: YdeI/OmpD-associated family protein [Bacteroidetes bacterium]|nr:YdeI/OmpD-associated family protein [Bacteroidota bacterium]MCL5025470.1 YdeI/OmpD-associated family protein [Chloroflexota bacterium]